MIDKIKVKVPLYPCADCEREAVCNYKKGCYAWKIWFMAYWRGLRRKVKMWVL